MFARRCQTARNLSLAANCGALIAIAICFHVAAVAQNAEKQWTARYMSGTETLDPGAELKISFHKDEIQCQAAGETSFVIPTTQFVALTQRTRTVHPVSQALGQVAESGANSNNPSDIAGGMIVGLMAAATWGIKRDEYVVGLRWEVSGVESTAVITLSKSDGPGFIEALEAATGQHVVAVDNQTPDALRRLDVGAATGQFELKETAREDHAESVPGSPFERQASGPNMEVGIGKIYDEARVLYAQPIIESGGDRVYLVLKNRVVAIGSGQPRPVFSKEFKDLPCHKRDPFFDDWRQIPQQADVLAHHCGAWFLIDANNLTVKKKLLKTGYGRRSPVAGSLAVSPAGGVVAAVIPTFRQPARQLLLVDTRTGDISARWPLSNFSYMSFNSDGTLLIIVTSSQGLSCVVQVRHMPSGIIHSEFIHPGRFRSGARCEELPLLAVPGHPELMANIKTELTIWNVTTGDVVKSLPFDKSEGRGFVSPDGLWIMTGEDKFVFRDLFSGNVLYEGTKNNLEILRHLGDPPQVSKDGRYLLVISSGSLRFRYSLYHLAKRATGDPAAQTAPQPQSH